MGLVLNAKGTVMCGHGGSAVISGSGKLTVEGAKVMLKSDIASWSIPPGCSQTKVNNGEAPCLKVISVSGGLSSKFTVGGSPVLLEDFAGVTNGNPKDDAVSGAPGQGVLSVV